MRSLRLDDDLEHRLKLAAAAKGESLTEFIRRAVDERASAVLAGPQGLDDVLGVVHGGGGPARRTGEAFREALAAREIQGR